MPTPMLESRSVQIPVNLDDRNCLLKVKGMFDEIHQSWLLPDGKIVAYENVPGNWPSSALMVWDSIGEYVAVIKEVDWICPKNILESQDEVLAPFGFPFHHECGSCVETEGEEE